MDEEMDAMDGMEKSMLIDLDKLPIKRLEAIEESGLEHFSMDIGPEEKQIDLVRRIDFSTVLERDKKKAKTSEGEKKPAGPGPWQNMVENLQQAQQELSVILDLMNTVEANDAVTVAGMTRPKALPNEVLSDLSVSAATKLQKFRHLGKYFKQSSVALEKQVAKETRFYGALTRLQQNWKVKRQRLGASGPGSEGFTIYLLDNISPESMPFSLLSSMSTVHIDKDLLGMLTVRLAPKSCRFLDFGLQTNTTGGIIFSTKRKICNSRQGLPLGDNQVNIIKEDFDECVKKSHSSLRQIHRAIFDEQAFDLVNCEAFNTSSGVNVIGMREDFIQLGISQEASVFLRLVSLQQDNAQQTVENGFHSDDVEGNVSHVNKLEFKVAEKDINTKNVPHAPKPEFFHVYLSQILYENMLSKAKERHVATKFGSSGQSRGGGYGILSHFCMTLAHTMFSSKVLTALENLASGVPYLHLSTIPTWNSRSSSWSISMKVPQSIIHVGQRDKPSGTLETKDEIRMQFHTTILVTDENINVRGVGAPSIVGSFGANSMDLCPSDSYECNLINLPVILLHQIASQVIRWLHEEALVVGMKASSEYLSLHFHLDEGYKIVLTARLDTNVNYDCISWWLLMDDGSMGEGKPHTKFTTIESDNRKFLGSLSLEALYSTLMDLVPLCSHGDN